MNHDRPSGVTDVERFTSWVTEPYCSDLQFLEARRSTALLKLERDSATKLYFLYRVSDQLAAEFSVQVFRVYSMHWDSVVGHGFQCKNSDNPDGGCDDYETRICCPPVDGEWSDWSEWTDPAEVCPSQCSREKTCTDPRPGFGGADCPHDPNVSESVDCCSAKK